MEDLQLTSVHHTPAQCPQQKGTISTAFPDFKDWQQEAEHENLILLLCVCTEQIVPRATSAVRKQKSLSMMKPRVSYALITAIASFLMPFFFVCSLQHSECGGWSWGCAELPLHLRGCFAVGNMEDEMQHLLLACLQKWSQGDKEVKLQWESDVEIFTWEWPCSSYLPCEPWWWGKLHLWSCQQCREFSFSLFSDCDR